MEDSSSEISKFLDRLKDINPSIVLYHMENLFAPTSLFRDTRIGSSNHVTFQQFVDAYEEGRKKMLNGINLGGVKHYKYSELSEFIDNDRYVLPNAMHGRYLRGSIQQDLGTKNVIIKTWDLMFPPFRDMKWQPLRLHNEMMLLINELKSHPNLPKLIGYSIDKKLAVIYDLKLKETLEDAIKSDDFGWEDRLKVAIQVAHMLQYFHGEGIIIGSIDSKNILIDEGGVIKLCGFGLTARMSEMRLSETSDERSPFFYISGRYAFLGNLGVELYDSKGKLTVQADICAFGILLQQLITKTTIYTHDDLNHWVSLILVSGEASVVDKSLVDDDGSGKALSNLVMDCLHKVPSQRPTPNSIVERLKALSKD